MITPEQVPDNVYYAAHDAVSRGASIREVIAAALNAWQGMTREGVVMAHRTPRIILPLPKENSDE